MTEHITLTVNGVAHEVDVDLRWTLVDVLRLVLRQTGTHVGCEHGVCGTCTVLVDGLPARACLILAGQADGHEIETVEGLGTAEHPHPLQAAFSRHRALQCGFCTPGFLMLAAGLLREEPRPDPARIRDVVASNLCRCTAYDGIIAAIEDAAGSAGAGHPRDLG
ncbi:(2Fe-2S)-binding protein [Pseudonocardia sulfidoxydans NBRC 16205]|uniref:(2Fe-2S)-binding protein n=1 Tax=Pseudonocardia sulfidoxydans NBRC 16205 TaxID=1223511 RepID=A0A511DEF0_9PSEU|nr:(2Fe-2S)-binding protein [Pseudonocardia sulfidoxydans]GEL23156.1 (2Fe-2S)-binding protein [Pseudonocardia sulfidoxydans NBRC 16205]